jgi:hypothetical protein
MQCLAHQSPRYVGFPGIKRDRRDRHGAGSGKITIEVAAVDQYPSPVGESALDTSQFVVFHDIRETDRVQFVARENGPL